MRASIDDITKGFAPDPVDLQLPDGFFTDSRNFRYRDAAVEKCKGQAAVFGSLSVTPMWAAAIGDGTTSYWIYGNESVLYATDGTTHANVSSASYNAGPDIGYTGSQFHGFQLLNDGVLAPQSWQAGLSNKVQPLANWPSATTCKVIRSFADQIIALRLTESGTYNPRVLRWSDIAGVGALPGSWDYTDPTNFAGRTELGETQDYLVDCLALRNVNIVYKQFSTYLMQPVQSLDSFAFQQLFSQSGLLAENCAAAFGARHFCVTADDIILHDGSNIQSVADKRTKRWFFSTLNASRYQRTFVVADFLNHTMWVCFCQTGNDFPNIALCWDWANDCWFVRELGANISHGATGIVIGSELTFDGQSGTFDSLTTTFDESTFTPFSNRLVLFNGAALAAYQAESGETFNGTAMSCYATRSNIGLTRDLNSIKRIKRIFPKVIGTAGDTFGVSVGMKSTPDGTTTFSGPFNLTVGTDYKIDCRVSGRWITLKFTYSGTNTIRFAGFDIEFDNDGRR
jgi:hypothetical protein